MENVNNTVMAKSWHWQKQVFFECWAVVFTSSFWVGCKRTHFKQTVTPHCTREERTLTVNVLKLKLSQQRPLLYFCFIMFPVWDWSRLLVPACFYHKALLSCSQQQCTWKNTSSGWDHRCGSSFCPGGLTPPHTITDVGFLNYELETIWMVLFSSLAWRAQTPSLSKKQFKKWPFWNKRLFSLA